ncbi:hypothetical protein F383_13341 [Gossypium arboreum]|uniref:Uncharacterized protein n=1 Tax=Gossypium arboreum TaxID=29729 RepID=A0A0B0MYZ9_GOSAR|nr:hypothetical protein F383_13341 [Gossypium arboreum]
MNTQDSVCICESILIPRATTEALDVREYPFTPKADKRGHVILGNMPDRYCNFCGKL